MTKEEYLSHIKKLSKLSRIEWAMKMKQAVKAEDGGEIVALCASSADGMNCQKYCAFYNACHWLYIFTDEIPRDWVEKFEGWDD